MFKNKKMEKLIEIIAELKFENDRMRRDLNLIKENLDLKTDLRPNIVYLFERPLISRIDKIEEYLGIKWEEEKTEGYKKIK